MKLELIKQHRYPWDVIEKAIIFYTKEKLTFRQVSEKMNKLGIQVSEKMNKLGIQVSHITIFTWVRKFSENVKFKRYRKCKYYFLHVSDTKFNGRPVFRYRAVDSKNNVLETYFSPEYNINIAKKNILEKYLKKEDTNESIS